MMTVTISIAITLLGVLLFAFGIVFGETSANELIASTPTSLLPAMAGMQLVLSTTSPFLLFHVTHRYLKKESTRLPRRLANVAPQELSVRLAVVMGQTCSILAALFGVGALLRGAIFPHSAALGAFVLLQAACVWLSTKWFSMSYAERGNAESPN